MADIDMCKGENCKQRMKCYRFTAYAGERQSYLSQPLLYAANSYYCSNYYYNLDKPNRFIKEKKRKLPWQD